MIGHRRTIFAVLTVAALAVSTAHAAAQPHVKIKPAAKRAAVTRPAVKVALSDFTLLPMPAPSRTLPIAMEVSSHVPSSATPR